MYYVVEEIQENNIEYELLPYQFILLTLLGIWCPKSWSVKLKNIHNVLFNIIFFLDTLLCIEMIIYFISSIGTNNYKWVNIFLTSASITGIYKANRIMRTREKLRSFIENYFKYRISNSTDADFILDKNKLVVRKITYVYCASMFGIFALRVFRPVFEESENASLMQLPVDAWYPYPIEKLHFFWLTYLHQIILGTSLICVHIGVDTMLVGLLIMISCQINIMKSRLQNISKLYSPNYKMLENFQTREQMLIFQCICEHNKIYKSGKDLNNIFQEILLIQVITSVPNLCINVYVLSIYSEDINMDFISTFFNTTSSLIQLFITCWYGNEVTLNSLQVKSAIYEMNWTMFNVSTQKLLVTIMARSLKPIEFSVGYIIPMNLDSFIKIIKTSYSVFTLLQKTST